MIEDSFGGFFSEAYSVLSGGFSGS